MKHLFGVGDSPKLPDIPSPASIAAYERHLNGLMRPGGDVADFERWHLLAGVDYLKLKSIVSKLNEVIVAQKDTAQPLALDVDGKPQFRVESFNPFTYEIYDPSHKRTPHVTGSLVLSRLLTAPTRYGANVYCAVEADSKAYGFRLSSMAALEEIAAELGQPSVSSSLEASESRKPIEIDRASSNI
jgi:hypothetical protein